jgi:glycosyltransferase involved in cell wall biosynthesis
MSEVSEPNVRTAPRGARPAAVPGGHDAGAAPIRSVVATLGPPHDKPWWWQPATPSLRGCALDYERLSFRGKYSQDVRTRELPALMLKVLRSLLRWRRAGHSHVFTFECDLVGFSIAFWQSLTGMRRPRHVIVQFIMREREPSLRSRAKYALMRFLFRSVHRVVVSSLGEVAYYTRAFRWPASKAVYVPVHTSPDLLERAPLEEESFYIAAGRSFRDYDTLVRAIEGTQLEVVIVGGRGIAERYAAVPGVRTLENIPPSELETLYRRARAVIVPLEDRAISTGQSVVLQAMALGKAVVATRTTGTVDYIEHMKDGLLVAPADAAALREALLVLHDPALRRLLGAGARARVAAAHLPPHYVAGIRRALAA